MQANQLGRLREVLLDSRQFLDLATHFIDKAVSECGPDEQFKKFYKLSVQAVTEENAEEVKALAGSPIERIFLNSLVLSFIKSDGLGLLVHPTFRDTPAEIAEFREELRHFKDFVQWFSENQPSDTMENFLDEELRRGAMTQDERYRLARLIFRYRFIPLDRSYQMTLQPRFSDVKVGGKTIRPDIYFWIPSRPEINIVVECDGFAYHSDKETYKSDRQRDRALKSAGYDVLRFSGSEIVADPVNSPFELASYLWARAKEGNDTSRKG